ncbi:MAG: ATP-binding protein [Pseudodesulfovibrio sp.]
MRIVRKIHIFILCTAMALAIAFAASYALQRDVLRQHTLVEQVRIVHAHVLNAQIHRWEYVSTQKGANTVWQELDLAQKNLAAIEPGILGDPRIIEDMEIELNALRKSFTSLTKTQAILLGAKARINAHIKQFSRLQDSVEAAIQTTIAEGYLYEDVDLLSLQELRNANLSALAMISQFGQLANQNLLLEGDTSSYTTLSDPVLKSLAIQANNVMTLAQYLKNPDYVDMGKALEEILGALKALRPQLLDAYVRNQTISATMEANEQTIGRLVEAAGTLSEAQRQRESRTSAAFAIGGVCGMLLLLLGGGYLFGRSITKPLMQLTHATTVLDYDIEEFASPEAKTLELDVTRKDELGRLARSFMEMREAIRQKVQDLQVLNETVEEQNRELMFLDELKDEFLSNTSHELRTPLSGIIGLAESLMLEASGPISDPVRHTLGMIAQSGRRLSTLINDLLDLSKLKHGDLLITKAPVNLRVIGDVVIALSQSLIEGKAVRLENNIPFDLPLAMADENRLYQIFHNLVGNATKFTREGTITLSARKVGDLLEVDVTDTGVGIPEESLDSIFISFEQADGSINREFGGVGLGLAITKQLVELHDGAIGVESAEGGGARFYFTLSPAPAGAVMIDAPSSLGENRAPDTAAIGVAQTAMPTAEDDTPRPRIIVVDDEQINLQVFVNQLGMHGFDVTPVDNGPDALNLIDGAHNEGKPYSLVVLDLMMPVMSGFEVCKKLRETFTPDELPVLILTARSRTEDMVEGFAIGANDYITKPFLSVELVSRIRIHIAIRDLAEAKKHDFTELQHLRNMLNNVINSMPSMLIGVDPTGTVTQWNHEAERVTGTTSIDAVGQSLHLVIPHLASEMERVRTAIATKQKLTDLKRGRKENGNTQYEDLTVYPLIANGVEGAVIRIDNVTDRVNLEQMMVQSEKMMSVGGLAAGMAHEINNPLAAILGYTHNVKKRIFTDLKKNISVAEGCDTSLKNIREYMTKREIPHMLDGILESGNRAATIVSNMLNFSRKSEKQFSPNDMATILDKTLELVATDYDLKKHYDFRDIDIVREYDNDVPPVYCEGNEIQQVFLNLIKNGAEAIDDKEYNGDHPRITCRIRQEGGMVVIEVEDNGPGMDEDARLRVFEPFFTTKEVGKGTGLGLSVSYFIITDQHQGSMAVDSHPGQWTRFNVKLPIADSTDLSST